MANDRRKKGCPNEQCEMHKKKKTRKAIEQYCSICGTQLVYVCAKCFKEIEDKGVEHRVCRHCEAQNNSKTAEFADKGKQVLELGAPALLGAVVAVGKETFENVAPAIKQNANDLGKEFLNTLSEESKKQATKAVKDIAKNIANGKIKK